MMNFFCLLLILLIELGYLPLQIVDSRLEQSDLAVEALLDLLYPSFKG